MHGPKEIIREAESLPVEERALVIDSLLKTLNQPDTKIDQKWAGIVKRRLNEWRSGRIKAVPGKQVFAKLQKRFSK